MHNQNEILALKIETVANKPGIYLWKNKENKVIYIGKAKNLKKRMKQYFAGSINSYKTSKMVLEITDFDVVYTLSERDALHLEEKMIKEYMPPYNIKLVNTQKSPYIKVSINKKNLIQFSFSEKVSKKESINEFYYGPLFYNDAHKNFIDVLKSFYTYKNGLLITEQTYQEALSIFSEIKEIFKYKNNDFINKLYEQEVNFALKTDFKNAEKYQKAQEFLKKTKEPQVTDIQKYFLVDYIYVKQFKELVYIAIKTYNYGIVTNVILKSFKWNGLINEFIEQFLESYYKEKIIPKQIYINQEISELELELSDELNKIISFPKIGTNALIINNLELNINEKYKSLNIEKGYEIFDELSKTLNIKNLRNIYIFDNSFEKKKDGVGVVLEINSLNYKRPTLYKWTLEKEISNFDKENDLKYMYFNIHKFLKLHEKKINEQDLFIADGSVNQIKEIYEGLKNYGFNNKVIGLVKNDFHKTQKVIDINNNSITFSDMVFKFFENIQHDVDKNAKKYLNKTRNDKLMKSELLNIQGLGEKTEIKLLNHFKDIQNIKNASLEELFKVVNKDLAIKIHNYFNAISTKK
ncbi:excinuclease ABC subunit C [Mycoplasmopsis canis UF31]|uniref:GIY-YIG nuclease family protein n=1 Tax=Mycoplasmopsis canis TaxID=29555 RepID=UPI00025ADC3A|nr:GIY-YIG nuclease family protein [Mycoplasmopsis canis]EIE40095.1 excinuclease ABC subunit C [Mycoplasmopsis canis UF31]